ncbi:MAG TPA: hypothetical protein VFQ32_11665 [Ktedonobacterales bacterium]|nr:hypothetical protein [Ktedonobacterales bacterium]
MPLFVHLAPANAVARIRRTGIKRGRWGVFCMPMLADYYSTHQWARELKRRGHRRMLAISFWLDGDEPVEVGCYSAPHKTMSASEAVKTLMESDERLGYEVIVPHAISPRAVRSVRPIPHVVGWRYYPAAHGKHAFCLCDWCSRGEIKLQRKRRYQEKRLRRQRRSIPDPD